MALPLRTRSIPQCANCLRSYAWASAVEGNSSSNTALRQQVRGKKKMAKSDGNVPVRLLKDLTGFGKQGSIIPVPRGEMRNKFFPQRIAEYVPLSELRHLRANSVTIERDYVYGRDEPVQEAAADFNTIGESAVASQSPIPPPKKPEVEKLTPERSLQLLEIFVGPRLDFYRQPILEEKEKEPEETKPQPRRESPRTASSAAFDLLAARTSQPKPEKTGPLAIYGSVSRHDVLVHIRAAIARNDEAAKVILEENDIEFLDAEVEREGKVKHVGDFTIEVHVKGEEQRLKRTVRVVPQEA
ncbi:hypothetical protein PRZ48_013190 [Zasmidium cellare]|uniref:Ribosomal protein L9 domain-containing protein n=1 Tax=Zasmidium cellare TaxID=395010 RepID=A0ABR0E3C2_ZASCE|nr:hypothetical protein PRZ48_013190 [Zasmidium cellare]